MPQKATTFLPFRLSGASTEPSPKWSPVGLWMASEIFGALVYLADFPDDVLELVAAHEVGAGDDDRRRALQGASWARAGSPSAA